MTHTRFSILLIFIFSLVFISSYGQKDLIITQAGEEIRCKILDETPTRFKYAYLGPKKKVLRNEIFKNLVSSFKYSYFEEDILKNDKEIPRQQASKSTSVPPRVDENVKKDDDLKPKVAVTKTEAAVEVPAKVSNAKEPEIKVPKIEEPVVKTIEPVKPSDPVVKVSEPVKEDKKSKGKKDSKKADSKSKTEILTSKPNPETTPKKLEPIVSSEISKKDSKDLLAKIEPPKIETPKKEVKAVKVEEKKKTVLPSSEPPSEYRNHLKFRTGVKGGLGNLTTKIPETNPYGLYREKLQRGYNFGADFAFFPKESIGIGINYLSFQANNKSKDLDILNPVTGENVDNASISNKISYKFIGPTFLFRKSIDFKTFVVLGVSPGMYLYSDKGTLNETNFNIKGNAYGAAASLGLDFLIGNDIFGRDIILSIESGYNYGKITKLNYGAAKGVQSLSNPIDLSRLDFSIGLRFTRFPMYLR